MKSFLHLRKVLISFHTSEKIFGNSSFNKKLISSLNAFRKGKKTESNDVSLHEKSIKLDSFVMSGSILIRLIWAQNEKIMKTN